MKLKILFEGEALKLYENTSIPVKLVNPMFNDIGSRTFSFDVPLENLKHFNHENRIGRINTSPTEGEFKAYFDGHYLFGGMMKVIKVSGNNMNCFFKIKESSFMSSVKEYDINELDGDQFAIGTLEAGYDATHDIDHPYCRLAPVYDFTTSTLRNDFAFSMMPITSTNYDNDIICSFNRLVFIKVKYLLSLIAKKGGLVLDDTFFKLYPEMQNLCLLVARDTGENYTDHTTNLPDVGVMEFMNHISMTFNITFIVNDADSMLEIVNLDDVLMSKIENDFTGKLTILEVERENYAGTRFEWKNQDNDSTLSDALLAGRSTYYEYMMMKDGETKSPDFSMITQKELFVDNFEFRFTIDPAYAPDGSSYFFAIRDFTIVVPQFDIESDKASSMKNRLFFHRGLQPYKTFSADNTFRGNATDPGQPNYLVSGMVIWFQAYMENMKNYPYMSQGVNDPLGVKISDANIALDWDGDYGLIENFHKYSLEWYKNRRVPVSGVGSFSIADFKKLNIIKKNRVENHNFIFNTISFNLNSNSISAIEFDAFRV